MELCQVKYFLTSTYSQKIGTAFLIHSLAILLGIPVLVVIQSCAQCKK